MLGPKFTGSVRVDDGVTRVMLAGELDLYAGPLATALLQEAVGTSMPSVVVDMALVSFCDAAGLGVLVAASNKMRDTGGQLSIRAAPFGLRRLLAITGLIDALRVEPERTSEGLLTADLAAAAHEPLTRSVLDAALKLVVVMSQAVMRGADGVSITLPREGQLRTVAASNDVVLQMDHDQYDTGQGPCLDAANRGQSYSSTALRSERRWPQFVPRARARGIESIMSTPILDVDRPLGALNVYSRAPDALASHEQEWAAQFASQATKVLMAADPGATSLSINDDIAAALRARETISLAQGIVMSRWKLLPDAAQRLLIDASRRNSRPLIGICEDVVQASALAHDDAAFEAIDLPGGSK